MPPLKALGRRLGWGATGVLVFLVVWDLVGLSFGSELIIPRPYRVISRFLSLCQDPKFLLAVSGTALRVIFGVAVAVPAALLSGIIIGLSPAAAAFSRPFFAVIGATPVLSIILIALLWFGQERTPVFTALLMIFPLLTANVAEGVQAADPKLVEMADAYQLPRSTRLRSIYLPTLVPFFLAGLRGSLALSWKVVIAAEVIAQPFRSLGAGMQNAKAQLETAELFAWTITAVILAAGSEAIFVLFRQLIKHRRSFHRLSFIGAITDDSNSPTSKLNQQQSVTLESINFSYNGLPVFKNFSLVLDPNITTAILGPSGCGKSTLLRLTAGLLKPTSGLIQAENSQNLVAILFQEPRLLPWLRLIDNVALALIESLGKTAALSRAASVLRAVGLADRLTAYPDELSGGQRQRVSLARAFAYPAPLILMDEPFQSLDLPLRIQLMDLTSRLLVEEGRGAVIVTHDPREAIYLAERILVLSSRPAQIVLDELVTTERQNRSYGDSLVAEQEARLLKALT